MADAIDPLNGPKLALRGRVATMDARNHVITDGVVYIEDGVIVAVRRANEQRPDGFERTRVVHTQGTIFPGLIELHNHLPYDVLPLWHVPKKFEHRGQWGGTAEYQRLITTPMTVLGRSRYISSVIRYVECKSLLAGVTTTQGVELFSNAGVRRYYRGIVRNVEQTNDPNLPEAATRIADVEAKDAKKFLKRLKSKKLILHLSEGLGPKARAHFLALHLGGREWAINENLVGIHCAGLKRQDFWVMADHGASMVWSPLSNLLLYGDTADVKAARKAGVKIGLGSDWSPTGSKNLLGEMKVARLVSRERGGVFDDREIVSMVTRNAAEILGWSAKLGSIEAGKYADLTVIEQQNGDPYSALLRTDESEIRLVMIGGVARAGVPSLVRSLAGAGEEVSVGGKPRRVYLRQKSSDPIVGKLTLKAAQTRLSERLNDMPTAARRLSSPDEEPGEDGWCLALDELASNGMQLRPRLRETGPEIPRRLPVTAPSNNEPIALDRLAVVDDEGYLDLIAEEEMNVPAFVAGSLRRLYA